MSRVRAVILGSSFIIGMLIAAMALVHSVTTFKEYDRTVTVKGLAEQEVKADTVIWPLQVVRASNDQSELYSDLEKDITRLRAFLEEQGFAADEITVAAPLVLDKLAERYASNDVALRYSGQQTVTIYSSQVDKVRSTQQNLAELGKQGVALNGDPYANRTEYLFNGLNELKPGMIEAATRNAREVGERFADDSNSKLGKIKRAQQGQFSISDRDSNNPQLKKVRVVSTVEYQLVD